MGRGGCWEERPLCCWEEMGGGRRCADVLVLASWEEMSFVFLGGDVVRSCWGRGELWQRVPRLDTLRQCLSADPVGGMAVLHLLLPGEEVLLLKGRVPTITIAWEVEVLGPAIIVIAEPIGGITPANPPPTIGGIMSRIASEGRSVEVGRGGGAAR